MESFCLQKLSLTGEPYEKSGPKGLFLYSPRLIQWNL